MTQDELIEKMIENGFESDILLTLIRVQIYDELVVQNGMESKSRLSTFLSFVEDDRILAKTRRGKFCQHKCKTKPDLSLF